MTREDHPSGTDRIAEAALSYPEATHLVNIQGDEPLIEPSLIDELASALTSDPALEMATAANPINSETDIDDPNVVKVVLTTSGKALYFSRSAIPFQRNSVPGLSILRHKGIYAYRNDFIQRFISWSPSSLEQAESLEQLRALENGASIKVIITDDDSIGVDTPAQALEIESILSSRPS